MISWQPRPVYSFCSPPRLIDAGINYLYPHAKYRKTYRKTEPGYRPRLGSLFTLPLRQSSSPAPRQRAGVRHDPQPAGDDPLHQHEAGRAGTLDPQPPDEDQGDRALGVILLIQAKGQKGKKAKERSSPARGSFAL